jgi:ribosomal-protein-alanine N-acetyltransferase
MTKPKIETMEMADLDDVMEIERASFSLPWSRWMFERELMDQTHSRFLVARSGDEIAGYIGFWMVLEEVHIVTIAVRSDCRRRGIGSILMLEALNAALRLGAQRATLEVRVTNLSAQELYKKLGFITVAIRKRFYSDTGEDAYVMWLYDLNSKVREIRKQVRQMLREKKRDSATDFL